MRQGTVLTDDGTKLSYQTFGDPKGPAVVFANGIGVDFPGATLQQRGLPDTHFICWDYRGVGGSRVADAEVDTSMSRHARDVLTVLDHLAVQRAIFIGWSMGVQVSLEVARQAPERMAGFCALLGAYGRPFRGAFPAPLAFAIEQLFAWGARHPVVAQVPLDLAVALPWLAFRVLQAAVFVGADADPKLFASNVSSVANMDRRFYLRTMLELATHDASDVLPQVSCPALVIAATRDHLTPPKVARHMVAAIPGAEYREVEGATHFALIERADLINGWLRELVDRAQRSEQ